MQEQLCRIAQAEGTRANEINATKINLYLYLMGSLNSLYLIEWLACCLVHCSHWYRFERGFTGIGLSVEKVSSIIITSTR